MGHSADYSDSRLQPGAESLIQGRSGRDSWGENRRRGVGSQEPLLQEPPRRGNKRDTHEKGGIEAGSGSSCQSAKSYVPCNLCGSFDFRALFQKASGQGDLFQVVRCSNCALVYVNPQPDQIALLPYYSDDYFLRRSDRGYSDYYSAATRRQICRVYEKNLRDLDFQRYEASLLNPLRRAAPRAFDIGCAAGYFIELLQRRGWQAEGIELSAEIARYGRSQSGLRIMEGDFLESSDIGTGIYDLVTLWASIEHLRDPRRALRRCYQLLRPGGRLLLSTCRYGWLARIRGERWRFMNVPEHLYFFSKAGLVHLASQEGFAALHSVSYGSGLSIGPQMGLGYRLSKILCDSLVKALGQGDMLAIHLCKRGQLSGD